MNRIVIPGEDYHDEIVATAIMAFEYNSRNGYPVRNWENASEDHPAWIEELRRDPRIMLMAHGIGAEKALCKMLGLPYSFGLGKYKTNDIPRINGLLVDNKNSWGREYSMKVNKEAVDIKIANNRPLPDLFSLVTGMLTRRYYGIGFIQYGDVIQAWRLREGKQDKNGKFHPFYEVEQDELWWIDKDFNRIESYHQMEMFV